MFESFVAEFLQLLRGIELSASQRMWSAAAPALAVVVYACGGLLVYLTRRMIFGPYRDAELALRGSSVLIGMPARHFFAWIMQPIWRLLRLLDLPATALTTLSVLLATGAAVAIAAGRFAMGGWLYVLGGLCDFFDGRLARAAGSAGPQGAALDSILDRYSDGVILLGLGWYYRDSWVLFAVGVLMIATYMVPYVRARGEGLGVEVKVGLMQRPERVLYLGLAVALSPILEALYAPHNSSPPHYLAILAIVMLAVSTAATVVQRATYLIRVLKQNDPAIADVKPDVGRLLRFGLSSVIATGIDFALVILLVRELALPPWLATFFGCGVGALVNFTINRLWAFSGAGRYAALPQLWRYGFVSASSALLNAGGVAVLMLLPADYRLAWWLTRGAVFLFWNYPLNRDYVFAQRASGVVGANHGGNAKRRTLAARESLL